MIRREVIGKPSTDRSTMRCMRIVDWSKDMLEEKAANGLLHGYGIGQLLRLDVSASLLCFLSPAVSGADQCDPFT